MQNPARGECVCRPPGFVPVFARFGLSQPAAVFGNPTGRIVPATVCGPVAALAKETAVDVDAVTTQEPLNPDGVTPETLILDPIG